MPFTHNLSDAPRRAVVLGAGYAGLRAAQVLAGRFEEVLLLERRAPAAGAPSIAAECRRHVLALPAVRLISGAQAIAPRCQAGRVMAARWRQLDDDSEHQVSAELVVDCTGRNSHTPRWLNEWGYGAPVEERVDVAAPGRDLPGATRPGPLPRRLQRRRYERVRHWPAGLLVMGDAIACLGPLNGQGMALAEGQALRLQAELRGREPGLARRFFQGAARAIEEPWCQATGAARPAQAASGRSSGVRRLATACLHRLGEAAASMTGTWRARALP